MTDPTPLSPQAQAVLDASHESWVTRDDPRSIAAAALRAAADQLTFEDSLAGAVISPHELLDIAAELDGTNTSANN